MSRKSNAKLDLTRFHETFFQESLECLAIMESGLLELSSAHAKADREVIHNVFRAAHSIKGASATFGFHEISEFTHLLETILDLLREDGGVPDSSTTDGLLQSIDWLRELIAAKHENREPDRVLMAKAHADLTTLLAQGPSNIPPAKPASAPEVHPGRRLSDLSITFKPHPHLFSSGNDPVTYLRELDSFGIVNCQADLSRLPGLAALDTELCFLAWTITIRGVSCKPSAIREAFEWIEDACDLEIAELKDQPAERPAPRAAQPESTLAAAPKDASIRVSTEKIDAVVNLVGELVITQSMLNCIGDDFQLNQLAKLREGLGQLTRNTRELQETVLKIRMLPIGNLFDRFPRLVHDLGRKLGKNVELKVTGEQTEVDKTVLERLSDPLVHLIRNSMDHGIERPDVRRECGKPEQGTLHLHAEHRGGAIVIEISDDGAGLNEGRILARARERGVVAADAHPSSAEIQALIFAPGFSTADEVTDLSGRGVGMDVVRRNVEELGGRIDLSSRVGFGTTITVQLPLTLAIMEGQLLRVGHDRFVVPLTSIVESLRIQAGAVHSIGAGVQLYQLRDEYLRVVHLDKIFNIRADGAPITEGLLVVVEARGKRIALRVDDLLAQQQVVIKSLEENFCKVEGIAGATILGDGTVAMILDIGGVMHLAQADLSPGPIAPPVFSSASMAIGRTI